MGGVCIKPLTKEEKLKAVDLARHPDFSLTYFENKNVDTHLFLQQPDKIVMTYYRYRVAIEYFEDIDRHAYYFFLNGPINTFTTETRRNLRKEDDWILDPIETYNIIKSRPECQNQDPAEIKRKLIEAFNTQVSTFEPLSDINLLRAYAYLVPLNIILGTADPAVESEAAIGNASRYEGIEFRGPLDANGNLVDPDPDILEYLDYMRVNLPMLRDNVIESIEIL